MAEESKPFIAPYIPFKRITSLLDKMAAEGIPARVDRSYLRWLSGNDQTYLQNTLKALDLIGPNTEVLPTLRSMVESPNERPAFVADLLRKFYAEALALDRNATHAQLEEVFREHYNVKGDTNRKAVTFYLQAAEYAGLTLSPHFKTPRAPRQGQRVTGARKTAARKTTKTGGANSHATGGGGAGIQLPQLHPALAGVLADLPPQGRGWTEVQKAAFMQAFTTLVDYTIPVRDEEPEDEEEPEEELSDELGQ